MSRAQILITLVKTTLEIATPKSMVPDPG